MLRLCVPVWRALQRLVRVGKHALLGLVSTCLWQPSTMISFCCGEVLAKTISVWYLRMSSSCSGARSFRSPPWTTQALASLEGTRSHSVTQARPRWIHGAKQLGPKTGSRGAPGAICVSMVTGTKWPPRGCSAWSVPWVDFVDWDVETGRDVFNGLVAFGDDAHAFSNGLGCDWMITRYHDNLRQGNSYEARGLNSRNFTEQFHVIESV